MNRYVRLGLVVFTLIAAAPQPMHVVVNGASLPSSAVAILDGKVYVAVRPVGEALGAYVTTNSRERSVTITTLLRQVVLHLDDQRAMVNGEAIRLAAAPRRNGSRIMLPLRALGAVFGASVTYKAKTHAVVVSAASRNTGQQAASPPPTSAKTFEGSVVAVNGAAAPPTIQFTSGGQVYTATVPATTAIAFRDVHGAVTGNGTLSAVRPGDALVVTLDGAGQLVSIADIFASINGTIASVADQSMVLTSGRVISADTSTSASVTLDGRPATFASLQAGDKVTLRADPISGAVREVVALTPGGYATTASATPNSAQSGSTSVAITGVTDNAQRAFRSGDVLKVALDGTPGGRAEFDLSDVFAHNVMREVRSGHYEGDYVVSVGTNLADAPVLVRLTKNSLTALVEAPDPLTIITTPPSVGETAPAAGGQINITRPNIVATFVTVGNKGMDTGSLILTVNGQDVTAQTTRTPSFISYYPPADLPPGVVDVRLRGTDIAGNGLAYEWSFKILGE